MLQNLFSMLKTEWGRLSKNTKDWTSHLERKDSTGSDAESIAARESLCNKNSFVSEADKQMQRVKSDTDADVRDAATKVQSYLENTESLHQQLTQLSMDDAEANRHAQAVQEARKAVTEQIDAIRQATSVHVSSSGTSAGGAGKTPPSNLFLDAMTCLVRKTIDDLPQVSEDDVTFTRELFFENKNFKLMDDQLDHLTQSWSTVAGVFFDPSKFPTDFPKYSDCEKLSSEIRTSSLLQQEDNLFTIHELVERLYDKLEVRVIHPIEIVSANI
jgi:hypothetical protein